MSDLPTANNANLEADAAAQMTGSGRALMISLVAAWFFDCLLMGIALSQAVAYARFVRTDRKHIVGLVGIGVACTAAASVCILLWIVNLFVWNFGRYLPFTELTSDAEDLARYTYIDVIATLVVQVVYVDRACRLFRHWWPSALIGPFVLGTAGVGFALIQVVYNAKAVIISEEEAAVATVKKFAYGYTWFGLTLLSDLLITLVITYGLYRFRTGWKQTDSRLRRLIVSGTLPFTQSFEAQVPALSAAIISIITWDKHFEIGLPFILLQTKIYVVSLLITLNLRNADGSLRQANGSIATLSGAHQSTLYRMGVMSPRLQKQFDQPVVHIAAGNMRTAETRPADDASDVKEEYGSTTYLAKLGTAV